MGALTGAQPDDGEVVRYAVRDAVATLTLDSPANRNALARALVAGFEAALDRAAADRDVRAVVLTHTGTTFCAGADLREALADGVEATAETLLRLLRGLVAHRCPVVALVDGHVRAGGLGLVGACDVVVAGPRSTFAFTESRLGLAPAVISAVTTPRMTSRAAGRYYLTGETFDAAQAQAAGLVTVAADDPGAAVDEVLGALRLCSPQGLAESKKVAAADVLAALDATGPALATLSASLFASDEAREGMTAFAERRPPSWAR
jgi:enoyl-CoA hydratase